MVERDFDAESLYGSIVRFYIDKKRYAPQEANRIAQLVVVRETQRRRCRTCGHMNHSHIANARNCLHADCLCPKFVSGLPPRRPAARR